MRHKAPYAVIIDFSFKYDTVGRYYGFVPGDGRKLTKFREGIDLNEKPLYNKYIIKRRNQQ